MIAVSDAFVAGVAAVIVALIGTLGLVLATRLGRALDTHNAKTPGETLHDVAQTMDAVAAVQHLHTRTLDAHGQLIEEISTKLDGHIEERSTFEPLIGWVKEQMVEESAEKEET